jgi:hypothetical protein
MFQRSSLLRVSARPQQRAEFVVFVTVRALATAGQPFRVVTIAVDQPPAFPLFRCFFFTYWTSSIFSWLQMLHRSIIGSCYVSYYTKLNEL